MDNFLRFIASPAGRITRVAAGTSLIAAGLAQGRKGCSNQMRLLDQTFNQGYPFTRLPALTAYGVTRVGSRHFSISRRRIRKRSQPTRSATPATTSAP